MTWKNERTNYDHYRDRLGVPDLTAITASTLSSIEPTYVYALNFPAHYETQNNLFNTNHPFGYLCVTFHTNSEAIQTLLSSKHIPGDDKNRQYHEITVTHNEIRIHGYRDGNVVGNTIHHDTTKWTTLFLE